MVEHNKSLKQFNTFGFDQRAEHFATASNDAELEQLVTLAESNSWPVFILGGGSNIVLTKDIAGLVIHMSDRSFKVARNNTSGGITVSAGGGVVWNDLVLQTLRIGAYGLENLSLIPGHVGAAPVQNIGAYGVEVKDRIRKVRAFHLPTRQWREFANSDCRFSYRNSFFKDHLGEYVITNVEFNLGSHCKIEAEYASLDQELKIRGILEPTHLDICKAVTAIRQSRLPDPEILGNAGSFFHNPIVSDNQYRSLEKKFPEIVNYPANEGFRKLSAAWMIDHAGFKGVKRDGVGVYDKQALVLINTGAGSGEKIVKLCNEIREMIIKTFGVELTIEPLIL